MGSVAFVVGGLSALVALAAGVLAHVDPITSLWRAVIAFILGWIGVGIWQAVIGVREPSVADVEPISAPPGEAETS